MSDDQGHTFGSRALDQIDKTIYEPATSIGDKVPNRPSELDTSGVSDQNNADDREALEEANTSKQQSDTHPPSRDFRSVDNRNISLSDIQRHERESGLNNPGRSTAAGPLQRASFEHDLPRSSATYGLRPNPRAVKKYGSPVSLLKKLTKSKKR